MKVITRLEFELAYFDSAVHRFNHYTTRTPKRERERERERERGKMKGINKELKKEKLIERRKNKY